MLLRDIIGSPDLPGRLGRALLVVGSFVVFGFAELLDVITSCDGRSCTVGKPLTGAALVPVLAGGVVVVLAAVALRRRSGPSRTAVLGLVAAAVVLAVSAGLFALAEGARPEPRMSVAEVAGTLLLVGLVSYRSRPGVSAGVAGLTAVALSTGGLRVHSFAAVDVRQAAFLIVWPVAAGWYLRLQAQNRVRRVADARQAERLALARDLHDVVAHHVTGMVVQTQALLRVAERNPSAVPPALAAIEEAGIQALTAMRRMVVTMREGEGGAVTRRPAQLRADLEELVGEVGGPPVHLVVDGDGDRVPGEVASSVLRVVQEALTNASRYARNASRVDVAVGIEAERLTIAVRDDGRPGGGFRHGGGHGLTGMRERVALLGGDFEAGPRPDGWYVSAVIPLSPPRTETKH